MAYSVNSIRRTDIQQTYTAYSNDLNTAYLSSDTCMTRSSTKELLSPFENSKQKFRSKKRLFDTPSLVESNSQNFDRNFDIEEQSEEIKETLTEKWSSGQFLKELRDNTFSGSEHEDANEHIKKKVNEKVYVAQVGYEICKGPHYTKDCPQKEEGKTLEEAYYTQFSAPSQPGGQYRAAGPGFYQRNNRNSLYPDRRPSLEESLTKFMAESAKRSEENSNIIKEI
ncbi:hypothetical protein Tco_0568808 [Tanacetum coccineum]